MAMENEPARGGGGGGQELLHVLDEAPIRKFHFTAVIIAGMGFFTDAYDLFAISLVTKLLGRIYYTEPGANHPGSLPINVSAAVNGVALCGTLVGQLFFGWLGDKLGRKSVYGITLVMMVFSSIASGLSFHQSAKGVMITLCFFRFWLGFGIGGDYPLSATIMAEYATRKTRGAFISAVFAMQGVGILTSGIVSLIVSAVFQWKYDPPTFEQDPIRSLTPQADYIWRIILMFGALPAALTYYYRLKMPEPPRYTVLVQGDDNRATQDMRSYLDPELQQRVHVNRPVAQTTPVPENPKKSGLFSREFAMQYGLKLLGTTTTWFLLDIAFYSQNLFQKDIFTNIGWIPNAKNMSAIGEVFKVARAQTLIALCGTVPGYWFTVGLIDIIGRKTIQILGFLMMTIFMFAIAFPYEFWKLPAHRIGFLVMYGLTFFFANFGPNTTTFVMPAEIFPARLRSTCHGISAASGKAGAIVGAFGFLYLSQEKDPTKREAGYQAGIGKKNSLIVLGVINFIGMLFTFLLPETKGVPLEEAADERPVEQRRR